MRHISPTFMEVTAASIIGSAVVDHLFEHLVKNNYTNIMASFDGLNNKLSKTPMENIIQVVNKQAMMVSFKEIYGLLLIAAILFFIVFLFYQYPYYPKYVKYPKLKTIRKFLKREIA